MRTLYEDLSPEDERELAGSSVYVDANQSASFERLLEQSAVSDPDTDISVLALRAAEAARSRIPTAEQAAKAVASMRLTGYCYLAFCGIEGRAQYMKVGMSTHPERRLYGLATGSPLDCLWVFTARLQTRKAAYHVEQTLLRHMAEYKRRGEWIEVSNLDADGAAAMARHLTLVAQDALPDCGSFSLLGFTDGRIAA